MAIVGGYYYGHSDPDVVVIKDPVAISAAGAVGDKSTVANDANDAHPRATHGAGGIGRADTCFAAQITAFFEQSASAQRVCR